MRNDYPNHPAGPLRVPPDPAAILEVRQPRVNAWIFLVTGFLLLLTGPLVGGAMGKAAAVRAKETGQPAKSPPPIGFLLAGLGLASMAGGAWMLKDGRTVVRVRPDGVEFPLEGLPPIRWDEVLAVDIATLNLIGGGGEQDYLGIKLRPGVLPEGSSAYSTVIMRTVRAVAGWDFDVCLSQNNLDLCPAHLSMQMRARLENFQQTGVLPPPPEGLAALPSTPMAERIKVARAAAPRPVARMGCAAVMGLFACLMGVPALMMTLGIMKLPADAPPEMGDAMAGALLVNLVILAVAVVFVWPWPDDEDE